MSGPPSKCPSHGEIQCKLECSNCGHLCSDHGKDGCNGAGDMEEVCACSEFEDDD